MAAIDEPVLRQHNTGPEPDAAQAVNVPASIGALVRGQPFAVLCTQGSGQPYGSVVAYAINEALDSAVFATGRATRKYNLLTACDRVALVIDSRSVYPDRLMKVEAITATGHAVELSGDDRGPWATRLVACHPQLRSFVESPSTALFRIDITRYLYVTRFQEVHQWVPGSGAQDG